MTTSPAPKNGTFAVIHGGCARRIYGRRHRARVVDAASRPLRTQERLLDREMRELFNSALTPEGTRPSRAVQEIVEERQYPWRKIARRIRELALGGVPKWKAKGVIRLLEVYTETCYTELADHQPEDQAA